MKVKRYKNPAYGNSFSFLYSPSLKNDDKRFYCVFLSAVKYIYTGNLCFRKLIGELFCVMKQSNSKCILHQKS